MVKKQVFGKICSAVNYEVIIATLTEANRILLDRRDVLFDGGLRADTEVSPRQCLTSTLRKALRRKSTSCSMKPRERG